jgi:hypothetical protein
LSGAVSAVKGGLMVDMRSLKRPIEPTAPIGQYELVYTAAARESSTRGKSTMVWAIWLT